MCCICGWHAIQENPPEECVLCSAGTGAFVREYELEAATEAEAEVQELVPGLWRLRNASGWGHASYLIERPSGSILIDCPDVFTPELVEFLNQRGGVSRVLYCHHHFLGAGQRARQLFSARTILHAADAHSRIVTVPIDHWLTDDETSIDGDGEEPIRGLLIGGHTPGSVFFHHRGMLFTGDAFSGWSGPLGWYYTDISAVQAARKRLADLTIKGIFSSYGHTMRGAARQILGSNGGRR